MVEMKEIGCMFMWVFFVWFVVVGLFVWLGVLWFCLGGGLGFFSPLSNKKS